MTEPSRKIKGNLLLGAVFVGDSPSLQSPFSLAVDGFVNVSRPLVTGCLRPLGPLYKTDASIPGTGADLQANSDLVRLRLSFPSSKKAAIGCRISVLSREECTHA